MSGLPAGALFYLGYVGVGIWPCALVAWAALWSALEGVRDSRRGCALAGFVFGWVAHAGGYAWLWRLVDVFLGGNALLGGALWLAHSIWFASGYALYALLYRAARVRGWPVAAAGIAPLVAIEWLYPQLFPVHLGDAFIDRTLFVQLVDLGGPLLSSALALLVNAALFETARWLVGARQRPAGIWILTLLALASSAGYGAFRVGVVERAMARAPELRVGIVQANLGVLEKRRDPAAVHRHHIEQTRELLAEGALDLVVWPETVYTRGIKGPFPVAGQLIRGDIETPLLFGAASIRTQNGQRRIFNSALLIQRDGTIRESYDKNLLVPIAEQLPFRLERVFPHAQDFGSASDTPPLGLDRFRIATPICYEAAVTSFVRRIALRAQPHLFVMLSNDAWFGDSQEPRIHLALARMRAVEHHRFVVRATNSGISAVIDPFGRVVARSGLLTRENLRGTVTMLEGETLYARFGDWVGWLCAAATVFGLTRRMASTRDSVDRSRSRPPGRGIDYGTSGGTQAGASEAVGGTSNARRMITASDRAQPLDPPTSHSSGCAGVAVGGVSRQRCSTTASESVTRPSPFRSPH